MKIETNGTKSEEPIKITSLPFICDLTQYASKMIAGHHDGCPWLPRGYEYDSDILDGLHTEIEYFNWYMIPTSIEYALRSHVVKRIESLILQVWPFAYVEVTGSLKYGLYLPTSDILLAVQNCSNWSRSLDMLSLRDIILASDIAELSSVKIVSFDTNEIPAIHLIDRESKIKIEIIVCVNVGNIIKRTELIKANLHKYPILSELILVLKQFGLQYNLNSSNVGISSYGLITMCINYLQSLSTQMQVDKNTNLGFILIGFLDFYGRIFDYRQNCIVNDGRFLPQEEKKRGISLEYIGKMRCFEDPLILLINTTRPLNHIEYVKCAFQYAHNLLSSNTHSIIDTNGCARSSLLGRIIQISDEVIEYRKWIQTTFKHTFSNR